MSDEQELPGPIVNDLPAWQDDLVIALGYTLKAEGDQVPTAWNLPPNPFAFLEETGEVIVWEVDGPLDERGLRLSKPNLSGDGIALVARRYPMPSGFALQTITTTDGQKHRIAIRDAA